MCAHHGCLLMKLYGWYLWHHFHFIRLISSVIITVPWPLLWILAHLLPRRVFYRHGVVPVEGDHHHAGELPASLHPQVPAQTLLPAQLLQAHLVNSERSHVCDRTRLKGGLFPVIILLCTAIRDLWDGLLCPEWKKQCYFVCFVFED